MPASNRMPLVRRVSNRWTQAENPGENHWTIGRYDFNLVRQISYFYEILARTTIESTIEATIEASFYRLYKVDFVC